jgi:hypothetical protein
MGPPTPLWVDRGDVDVDVGVGVIDEGKGVEDDEEFGELLFRPMPKNEPG